jgi:hypothetical protein
MTIGAYSEVSIKFAIGGDGNCQKGKPKSE